MKIIARILVALALLFAPPVLAQTMQPPPVGYAVLGSSFSLAITGSSTSIAFPTTCGPFCALTIYNSGAQDVYFALGGSSVVAVANTTMPNALVKAGTAITIWVSSNTYIAGITASSTSTLTMYQGSGPVNFSGGGGSGGGGGGNVTIVGPLGQTTMSSSVPVAIASDQSAVPVTAKGAAASGAAVTGNPVLVGGSDGTNAQSLATDTHGNIYAVIKDGSNSALTYNANGQASAANSSPVVSPSSTVAGAAVATTPVLAGVNVSGALIQATASAPISISTGTTTQLVALSSGKAIYVTNYSLFAGGTGNVTLEYGTGSNCGTGTTVLTGIYNLTAQAGLVVGNGTGPVLVVPASNALCALTSASVQISGSVAYAQF